MKVSVKNMAGQEVSEQDLPASIFDTKVNVGLMHQALVRQMSNSRRGTHKAKGRSEISRTTRKMYRQKGTGNARHGSRRAPIFVGGGVAHGPLPRDYSKKMPKKMRHAALKSALTVKANADSVIIVDQITMESYKTKEVAQMVANLVGDSSALIVLPIGDKIVEKSTRNLADVKALRANYLNIRDLLGYDKLVLTVEALDAISALLEMGSSADADESRELDNEVGEE